MENNKQQNKQIGIWITKEAKDTKIIDCGFDNLDIGIKDEGKNTLSMRNEFSGKEKQSVADTFNQIIDESYSGLGKIESQADKKAKKKFWGEVWQKVLIGVLISIILTILGFIANHFLWKIKTKIGGG